MKWGITVFGMTMALALTLGIAAAESPSSSSSGPSGTAPPNGGSPSVPETRVVPPTPNPADAVSPQAVDARLNEIRERARTMAASKRASVEKELTASSKRVDTEATRIGESPVRDRIAAEFGLTPEALAAEREQFGIGWGELLIAHTLVANSKGDLTLDQVRTLRGEGLGWCQLVYGLGVNTEGFIVAMKNEVSVARGTAKPDGKPALVASTSQVPAKGSKAARTNEVTAPSSKSSETGTPAGK
jgi:hypothetical protein